MPISRMLTSGRMRQHPARSQAPTSVPGRRRWRTRCQTLQGGDLAAEGDVCVPRRRPDDEDRATGFCGRDNQIHGPNPVSHPPHEPPFDLQRKGSGGGVRTRGTRRARPRRAWSPEQRARFRVLATRPPWRQLLRPRRGEGRRRGERKCFQSLGDDFFFSQRGAWIDSGYMRRRSRTWIFFPRTYCFWHALRRCSCVSPWRLLEESHTCFTSSLIVPDRCASCCVVGHERIKKSSNKL